MVSGFLGTVISLERAVALGFAPAFAAPLACGVGTGLLLAGFPVAGAALWIAASLGLLAASVAIARRQLATHTVLLAVAALAWVVGNVAFAAGGLGLAVTAWFAFLTLTIASERLEMTRLAPRPRWAAALFLAVVAALLLGVAGTAAGLAAGRTVFGLSLVALAAWLFAFDIARRTIRSPGFARYAAVALLAGYLWLAVGGLAWTSPWGRSDLALHGLGLGFVFSMILAHAPVVVPVVARRPMSFTPLFYAPLALLHGSLAWRMLGAQPAPGAVLNAVAIALFAATVLLSLKRGRT